MGSVTAVFTSENRLHPAAAEILADSFERGWADPTKPHTASRELTILINEARSTFSQLLDIPPGSINFLSDTQIGFHLGINGLHGGEKAYLPATARKEAFAALSTGSSWRHSEDIPVNLNGEWKIPSLEEGSLLIHPTANLETGARAPLLQATSGPVFIDSTADPLLSLPAQWSAALWDSKSWCGPGGLALLAIADQKRWRNPIPHIDSQSLPGTPHPALVIASAIALEASKNERQLEAEKIERFNREIRAYISDEIGDVDIASPDTAVHQLLSFSFLYVHAERLVDAMEKRGFSIDSGSACISANIEPSHVLAAMGRLTHGNIRLHLYPDTTQSEVDGLLKALHESVNAQRTER